MFSGERSARVTLASVAGIAVVHQIVDVAMELHGD